MPRAAPWQRQAPSGMTAVAVAVAALVVLELAPAAARPCTLRPGNNTNKTAAVVATAPPQTNASSNASNSSSSIFATTPVPITTPAPGIREKAGQSVEAATAQAQADKQAALKKAADAKMGVSEDLNYVNETWVNITQRQLFPHVTINRDVESFSAAVLMLLGLFAGLVGFQYARVVFVGLAFVAGTVISMYPIDVLLGDTLCGPYYCDAYSEPDQFCGWALAAGLVAGMVSASGAVKAFEVGLIVVGAGMMMLPALLLQSAFDRALSGYPSWTHYLHYLAFAGLGAALTKWRPHVLLIAITSVVGALLVGMTTSYFLDAGLTVRAISGTVRCGSACTGMAVAVGVAAIVFAVFQTWRKRRLDAKESGEDIEEKLEITLKAQQRLLKRLEDTDTDTHTKISAPDRAGTHQLSRLDARQSAEDKLRDLESTLHQLEIEARQNMFKNNDARDCESLSAEEKACLR